MALRPLAPQDTRDEQFMRLALQEAQRGKPSPNPHVGAVVVCHNQIIGVGHHAQAGQAHAEIAAIRSVSNANDLRRSTLYVTFEPCNHYGRTPPCTGAIIDAGIPRVVIGCRDTAPHIPGAVEKLRQAGIAVHTEVCAKEALAMVADFTRHRTQGLPYVTLKAATSLDGRIALSSGASRWISNALARTEAHRLRAESDAIAVGIGTVLCDDPQLTVRHTSGPNPIRVVFDSQLRIPLKASLVTSAHAFATWVLHASHADQEKREQLQRKGVDCIAVPASPQGLDLKAALHALAQRDIVRLLVEGGSGIHSTLLAQNLAQRMIVFMSMRIFAEANALPLVSIPGLTHDEVKATWKLNHPKVKVLDDNLMIEATLASSS